MRGHLTRRQFAVRTVGLAAAVGVGSRVADAGAAARAPGRACARRYAGYSTVDRRQPWAAYLEPRTAAPQEAIDAALARGPVAASRIPPRGALGAELRRRDPDQVETGYGMTADGLLWVAALTKMPRVRPEMWDWWFGWHSDDSSKYKLWHPDAHRFAALRTDRVADPRRTDRQKYVGNVSYVDEYIGRHLQQLAIAFVPPASFGIDVGRDETVICGRVGSSIAPLDVGVLAHQVRAVPGGSEMRSRFYLNALTPRKLDPRAAACAVRRGIPLSQGVPPFGVDYGRELLEHCGAEMHHLARFLPDLYEEFGAD